jgi:hypothetical protein
LQEIEHLQAERDNIVLAASTIRTLATNFRQLGWGEYEFIDILDDAIAELSDRGLLHWGYDRVPAFNHPASADPLPTVPLPTSPLSAAAVPATLTGKLGPSVNNLSHPGSEPVV